MTIAQLWKNLRHRSHDCRGDAKFLRGRPIDASASAMPGVPDSVRDDALGLICDSFEIPRRQMYCLRRDDALLMIYDGINGPRDFDLFQFERLGFALEKYLCRVVSPREIVNGATVADIIQLVAAGRLVSHAGDSEQMN
jgi:hypothetical protein